MRLVLAGVTTNEEADRHLCIDDVAAWHDLLDLKEEAEEEALARSRSGK